MIDELKKQNEGKTEGKGKVGERREESKQAHKRRNHKKMKE